MHLPRVFISSCCTVSLPGAHLVMSTPLIRCVWPCAWPDKVETRECGICCCCCHSLCLFPGSQHSQEGDLFFFSPLRPKLSGGSHSPSSLGHTTSAWALWGYRLEKTSQGMWYVVTLGFTKGRSPVALCLSKPCLCLCFYVPVLLPPF